MKTRTLIFSLASILLLALTTCKKDPQPIMERFDLSREDLTIGTTSASIVGTYVYSGAIDEITVCVSEDGVHPATFVADINGKNFTVEMTGLRPATSYQYYYSVDYGFSKPFTTEAKTFTTLSESPTVRTIDVISIDSTTVRVNCETVSDGGVEITERGVCWNTYGNPNLDDECLTYTSAGLGQYSCRISGLALSTKYYVRAYAKNASGIGFGEVLEFETLAEAQLPEVSTVEVNNVTFTTATCMGNVASDGGLELIERGVCWSLSANPTTSGNHATATDATLGVFEISMTGLTPNKTYHARAYATNAKGTAYGDDLTFTTTEGLPVVTTSGITEITATSAKGGGEVTDQGASNVTERGICWGTSHNPTTAGAYASSGTGIGSYTVSMTNLTPNATYYVRAYATNSQGTAYGAEVSFTALEGLPVVLTLDMTDITSTTAKGHGKVADQGGSAVTERGVCWSTSPSPTTSGSHAQSGTGTGEYTVSISNLTPGTRYYVRAYATNSQGTTYGEQKDFTTAATLPTVVTGDISGTTAHGEVTDAGGAIVTERGICWGTSHNPTTAGTHGSSGTGTGSFSVELTDLAPGTTYYVRAFATNSQGTAYGNEVSFVTSQMLTYTITVSANPTNGGSVSGGGTYQAGQSCTVTATANTSYAFTNWTENGSVVSTNANYSFTVNGNRTLVANFSDGIYSVSAVDDYCTACLWTPTIIPVLDNDIFSPNSSGATVSVVQQPPHGEASPDNNQIEYIFNDANYTGTTDQFKYRVTFHGLTSEAWVYVTVGRPPTVSNITEPSPICTGGLLGIDSPTINPQSAGQWVSSTTPNGTFTPFDPTNVPLSMNGHWVRYSATNDCGEGHSNAVQITVTNGPSFTGQTPQIQSICAGESLNLTPPNYNANGSQILSSGWVASPSANGNYTSFDLNNIPLTYNGYYIRYMVEGSCGLVYSQPERQLTVNDCGGCPEGAINGLFTINANGDQVYFSQGNLQYIGSASTPYWKFADNQWDVLGTTTGQNSSDQNVDRDLFGWGTSGWNNGNTYYRPWDTNNSGWNSYGPDGLYDLTGTYANADWGVYNQISNGGNQANQWRTLTHPEWAYIFNTRTTSSGIRYAKAKVNDVNGVILLPDDWSSDTYSLSNTNSPDAGFSSNTISASQWNTLEQAGAVFLPAAGIRSGTSLNDVGSHGFYWSASYNGTESAFGLYFDNSALLWRESENRCSGRSVRLVQDFNR